MYALLLATFYYIYARGETSLQFCERESGEGGGMERDRAYSVGSRLEHQQQQQLLCEPAVASRSGKGLAEGSRGPSMVGHVTEALWEQQLPAEERERM